MPVPAGEGMVFFEIKGRLAARVFLIVWIFTKGKEFLGGIRGALPSIRDRGAS